MMLSKFGQKVSAEAGIVTLMDDLEEDWPHARECLRVTYCQDPERVALGAAMIGEEARKLYSNASG